MHAGYGITANIETNANRPRRQHFQAAAIVQSELCTDLAQARPAGAVRSKSEDRAQSRRQVRLGFGGRCLNHEIAVVDNRLRITGNKVWRVCKRMLSAKDFAMAVSKPEHAKLPGIEVRCSGGRGAGGLQTQFLLNLSGAEQCEIGSGARRKSSQNQRQDQKTSDIFHSRNYNPTCLMIKAAFAVIVLVVFSMLSTCPAFAQIDDARQAINRGEFVKAVNILLAEVTQNPSADAYLYLGLAYGHMKEYQKAEDTFKTGVLRYPQDSRFHNELANLHLENNDRDAAKSELRSALQVDPANNYASDLLATIDMSEGDVQSALRAWNKSGRPVINDILHNYYLTFGSWVVRDAVAFHPTGILRYSQWKTTESRLFQTDNFANVGLEIEPTTIPDQYNAVIRTTTKTNSLADLLFGLLKGAPVSTSYLDAWNIGNTGMNFNGSYRWDTDRRRVDARVKIPLPVPGLLQLDLGGNWRAERWDLSPAIRPSFQPRARFDYRASTISAQIRQIPHYRFEWSAGVEYRNRYAKGNLPELLTDSRNTGRFTAGTTIRLADGRYQNRLHLEAFAARRSILGDTNFSGGTAELNNRVTLSKDSRTFLDWNVKTGTARGRLPVEDYFVLGLDTHPSNLLRGHTAAQHGRYGHGPMGTDFALVNTDIERRIATLPFFNTVNIPFVTVKWEVFFDGARTWDRNRIFQQGKLLLDTGGGLRFETPTHSLNLVYGRSLRDGKSVLFGYVERRFW